jgi:hypothetical protein
MERNRLYNRDHPHRESPESRKKSNRKYRISSYGLTQELFDLLLEAQQNACGMCHDPFGDGQLIHVDHNHACCPGKNRSCGECIRGLLATGAISRWATSSADMRWLAPTWTALPSGSWSPLNLQQEVNG